MRAPPVSPAPACTPAPSAVHPQAHRPVHALAHPLAQIAAGLAVLLLLGWGVLQAGWFGPLRRPDQAAWPAALLILGLGLGMTAWDLAFMHSWRRALTAPDASARLSPSQRQARRGRVLRKWLGLQAVLLALALAYLLLKEYRAPLYQPFFQVAQALWLPASVLALPYIAWVDARMADPHDLYWRLGDRLLGGRWTAPEKAHWLAFVGGWVVKGFFLPMMFGYAAQQLVSLWQQLHGSGPSPAGTVGQLRVLYEAAFTACYFIDVIWGATGYLWSVRLTDSHVRSVQPTVGGWLAALACYEPFSKGLWPAYFAYGSDKAWGYWMGDHPLAYALWGSAIVALLLVYTMSTMAFGLRFSNLTHRGIVTHGPYRWCRHPAYLSKNLSWWLIGLPMLAGPTLLDSLRLCAMLLLVNALYLWRARTESQHLGADPAYRAYSLAVARRQRAWWAWWAGVFSGLRRPVADPPSRRRQRQLGV